MEAIDTGIVQEKKSCFFNFLHLLLIPFAVYGYFLLGYFEKVPLIVHEHSLILMGFILLTALIFAKHNAFYARCKFKNNIGEFNLKLKEYIVKNLMNIGNTKKSNSSFEIFVQQESKNIRNDNFASVLTGVFPTMGILGTFISIALTMPNFASSSSGELEKEIGILLSGVGTAFYVSIYGILLSLWWIFYEKIGLSLYEKDLLLVKENTKIYFWTKEEIEQSYLQENLSHFKELASMLNTISGEDFLKKLSKNIESKFKLFEEILKLEAQTLQESTKLFKQKLNELDFVHEKQLTFSNVHSKILESLDDFSKSLTLMNDKSMKNFQQINSSQRDFEHSFTSLNETLQSNLHDLRLIYTKFPQNLKQSQDNILSHFSKALDSSIHRFWQESQLSAIERVEKINDNDLEELKENITKTLNESRKLVQEMHELKTD